MATAAHQDTTMGKTPAHTVTMGMAMKKGVVRAPTRYDHTPEQYNTRIKGDKPDEKSGQCFFDKIIWKWPLHQRLRCWKIFRTSCGASPIAKYSGT